MTSDKYYNKAEFSYQLTVLICTPSTIPREKMAEYRDKKEAGRRHTESKTYLCQYREYTEV